MSLLSSSLQPNSRATADLLKKETLLRPTLAVVLGSGFHSALTQMKVEKEIPYGKLPGFLSVGVSGHAGKLVIGKIGEVAVVAMKGRAHYYEGHEMRQITFPIRVLADFGVKTVLLTNAAGGINSKFKPGDLMVISDHINFMGTNPLRGTPTLGLPRFVDLTNTYDTALQKMLLDAAKKSKQRASTGVYLAVTGPSYETPAEIRAFGKLGADAVGMSTAPEAIVARQCGLRVGGLSRITNLGAGLSKDPLSHQEVLAVAEQNKTAQAEMFKFFVEAHAKG